MLVILDASGRAMINRQIYGSQAQIDISGWPRGIYYVSVRQEKKTTTKKVVRE
jgi:hypothetical protein